MLDIKADGTLVNNYILRGKLYGYKLTLVILKLWYTKLNNHTYSMHYTKCVSFFFYTKITTKMDRSRKKKRANGRPNAAA